MLRSLPSLCHLASRAAMFGASALLATSLPAFSGCGLFSDDRNSTFSFTYKIDIQQGIVVTREMAEQLRTGMTRDQVRFVLGTPLLVDPFHANRWDYPFRLQPGRGKIEERRFTVWFENDKLARFEGDPLPTEEEFAASRNFATTKVAKAPPLGPAVPPAPGANAPSAGGATVTPATVDVRPKPAASQSGTPPSSDATPSTAGDPPR